MFINSNKENEYKYIPLMRFDYTEYREIFSSYKKQSSRKIQWSKLIRHGKLHCVRTGLKLKYIQLDAKSFKKGVSYHWNFYTECGRLLTVDHIIPKSKGGHKMHIDNLQPMVIEDNMEKSNIIEERDLIQMNFITGISLRFLDK